jgi:hypothetical protein
VSTLYEISEDLKALEDLIIEQNGDITDDQDIVMQWMDDTNEELAKKLENYGKLIQELQARSEARHAEAVRLRARATVDLNAAANLRRRLMFFFQERGMRSMDTASFKFSLRKSGGVKPMEFVEADVTDEFKTLVVDKSKIRKALEAGQELPFAKLNERGETLSIR